MPDQDQPKPVDFSDFTADVAARTGSSFGELSRRPELSQDELLAAVPDVNQELPPDTVPEGQNFAISKAIKQAHEWFLPVLDAWLKRDGALPGGQPTPPEFRAADGSLYVAPSERRVADWVDRDYEFYGKKVAEGFNEFLLVPHLPLDEALAAYSELVRDHIRRGMLRSPSSVPVEQVDMAIVVGAGLSPVQAKRLDQSKLLTTESLGKWSPLLVDRQEAMGNGASVASRVLPSGVSAAKYWEMLYGDPSSPTARERFMSPVEYLAFLAFQLEREQRILPPGRIAIFPDHVTTLDNNTAILCAELIDQKYKVTLTSTASSSRKVQERLKQSGFAPRCVPIGLES